MAAPSPEARMAREKPPAARGAKGFFTDTTLCIGCKACEVACKQWNQLPDDGMFFTGMSYDNTVHLGASTWRHVAFVERPAPLKTAGADGILVVSPYYNKPTQEGLYQHFKAIHDAVDLPLVVYNIPGRCVVDISQETLARLAKLPNIVGVKDATGDLNRPLRGRLALGEDFAQLSGDDGTAVAFLAQGGVGCISVTSNIAPRLCADMHDAWAAKDYERVFALRDALMPLHDSLFVETSPGPVKYASKLIGKTTGELRLPLVEIGDASKQKVEAALKGLGLI